MLVVNMFGRSGVGKSTMAAKVFAALKEQNVNCELVTEYAKDCVWRQDTKTILCQPYILGKQYWRLFRIKKEVDVAITDSPLLLSNVYGKGMKPAFYQNTLNLFNEFNNLNILIKSNKPYNPVGRFQDEEESRQIENEIYKVLVDNKVPFAIMDVGPNFLADVLSLIFLELGV